MTRINFITNQDLSSTSGGWSGISMRMYEQMKRRFDVNYIGPIAPPSFFVEKAVSKLQRVAGLRGKFHFFSEKRLRLIRDMVKPQVSGGNLNFFFGQTPWIRCQFNQPYTVYLDAAFPTYMKVYSAPEKFQPKDLARITQLEKEWLSRATKIFWGSHWALNEAEREFGTQFPQSVVVRVGGHIDVPESDLYNIDSDDWLFTFISLDFLNKGGWVCVKAFNIIRQQNPKARLIIIGQQPPAEVLQYPGVEYAGYLRKTNPEELSRFKSILSKATFMIHPTTMDTMGAVILESGYYGCPSIAPATFGIPDLVINNETGILVKPPFTEDEFAQPLLDILRDKNRYLDMRRGVRKYMLNELTWDAVGDKINEEIRRIV
jgi:glycosyltransferase involved in cell wall biosynthesis